MSRYSFNSLNGSKCVTSGSSRFNMMSSSRYASTLPDMKARRNLSQREKDRAEMSDAIRIGCNKISNEFLPMRKHVCIRNNIKKLESELEKLDNEDLAASLMGEFPMKDRLLCDAMDSDDENICPPPAKMPSTASNFTLTRVNASTTTDNWTWRQPEKALPSLSGFNDFGGYNSNKPSSCGFGWLSNDKMDSWGLFRELNEMYCEMDLQTGVLSLEELQNLFPYERAVRA